MKLVFTLLASLILAGCSRNDHEAEASPDRNAWYWNWIGKEVAGGASFHSEFPLAAGEVKEITLRSPRILTVGLVIKDGHEITKSQKAIFLGTQEEPHKASGSPGFQLSFEPKDGVINLRIENTASLNTRVALYTK